MEEPIKIEMRQEKLSIQLSKEDFLNFRQVIPYTIIEQLRDIHSFNFSSKILHIFLYFFLYILKDPPLSQNYQSLCRSKLIDYYLLRKMKIQLYQYSLIVSKIIKIKVQQCLHMACFLTYGKLVSVPYIHSICHNRLFKDKKNAVLKTSKSLRDFYRSNNKKKASLAGKSFQYKNFQAQLKNVLSTHNNLQPTINQKQQKQLTEEQRNIMSEVKNFIYIPHRIQYNENSALINLLFKKTQMQTQIIRKRKFKETLYNWNQSIDFKDLQLKKQNELQNKIDKSNNVSYSNLNSIADSIRIKNKQLQQIRKNCKSQRNVQISKNIKKILTAKKDIYNQRIKQQSSLNKRQNLSKNIEDNKIVQNLLKQQALLQTIPRSLLRKTIVYRKDFNEQNERNPIQFLKKKPFSQLRKYKKQYQLFLNGKIFEINQQ